MSAILNGISNYENNPYQQYYQRSVSANNDISPYKNNADLSTNTNDPHISSAKKAGKIECQTCKTRQYQDGSNDPGVSFKTPGHISPDSAPSVVMSHEQEHVRNESSKAKAEGREVISQSVSIQTSVCPECGRVYVSGGETRTVTKSQAKTDRDYFKDNYNKSMTRYFGNNIDTKV